VVQRSTVVAAADTVVAALVFSTAVVEFVTLLINVTR
jgi:hypothetical protein